MLEYALYCFGDKPCLSLLFAVAPDRRNVSFVCCILPSWLSIPSRHVVEYVCVAVGSSEPNRGFVKWRQAICVRWNVLLSLHQRCPALSRRAPSNHAGRPSLTQDMVREVAREQRLLSWSWVD